MSLPFESLLTLQAYADGELEGTEQSAAEKLLEESEEARAFVESLGALGVASRAAHALDGPPEIDVVSAVMARIEAETVLPAHTSVVSDSGQVTSLAAERSKRARKSQVVVVIGALALAAAGILYVRGHRQVEGQVAGQVEGQAKGQAEGPELAQSTLLDKAAEKGVEVHDIDSNGQSQVSVFYLPASGGNTASSVVVWIDDKGAP